LVDIHLTDEGKEKKYTSLFKGRIDLSYLKRRAEALYRKSLKPIDVNNPFFSRFYVFVPKSAEAYMEFYLRSYLRNNKIVLPTTKKEEREIAKYFDEYFDIFSFKELTTHQILFGLCVSEKSDIGILMNDKGDYYFFNITDVMNVFLDSITSNQK